MTNHIEQMMKAAGVKPYKRTYYECKGGRSSICLCPQLGVLEKWCEKECEEMQEKQEFLYPPFTPAKQLELIKLIADFHCFKDLNGFWNMTSVDMGKHQIYSLCCEKSFEDSLAEFTTHLIARITIDKAEVKRILEDK